MKTTKYHTVWRYKKKTEKETEQNIDMKAKKYHTIETYPKYIRKS